MLRKRKCADDAPSNVAKRAKAAGAQPRLASRDFGLAMSSALRSSRNKPLAHFISDEAHRNRPREDDLKPGETMAETIVAALDESW